MAMKNPQAVRFFRSELGRIRMLGGNPALDLANTIHWRDGREVDFIPDYASLVRWAVPAGILQQSQLGPSEKEALRKPKEAQSIHAEWIVLRTGFKHWLSSFVGPHQDAAGALQALSLSIRQAMTAVMFLPNGDGGAILAAQDMIRSPLANSAFAIAALLAFPPNGTIRRCEADQCGGYFLDISRSKPRRWCSMDGCGNREKMRRHRHKLHAVSALKSV
jgi:predicted RNA-binding Zn ribbon-like protein